MPFLLSHLAHHLQSEYLSSHFIHNLCIFSLDIQRTGAGRRGEIKDTRAREVFVVKVKG
jgi:hypothetical protein